MLLQNSFFLKALYILKKKYKRTHSPAHMSRAASNVVRGKKYAVIYLKQRIRFAQ